MAEVTIFIGPLIPDAHTIVLQVFHIGVASEEPQEFMDDRLEMQLLGSEAGETLLKVETHLVAKHADGAGAGAVALLYTFGEDTVEQV